MTSNAATKLTASHPAATFGEKMDLSGSAMAAAKEALPVAKTK
jgi:hypothetical protein